MRCGNITQGLRKKPDRLNLNALRHFKRREGEFVEEHAHFYILQSLAGMCTGYRSSSIASIDSSTDVAALRDFTSALRHPLRVLL